MKRKPCEAVIKLKEEPGVIPVVTECVRDVDVVDDGARSPRESDPDYEDDVLQPPVKKKRGRKPLLGFRDKFDLDRYRKFNPKWLKMPGIKEWIAYRPSDPKNVICRVCNSAIRAHLHDLKIHSKAKKHITKMEQYPFNMPDLSDYYEDPIITADDPAAIALLNIYSPAGDSKFSLRKSNTLCSVLDSSQLSEIGLGESLNPAHIGFIGAGNMAQALLGGFLRNGLVESKNVIVSAPSNKNLSKIKTLGVGTTNDNDQVISRSDMVFICVKPNILIPLTNNLEPVEGTHNPLFVSIIPGISITRLEELFKQIVPYPRVIRVMPNTPCLVSQGCCVFATGQDVQASESGVITCLLGAVGYCEQVPESLIDAASGLSASGPAYIYTAIEALADGGVKMGLSREISQNLAAQMVKGAATMVLDTGRHPAALKDEICQPGGTTIAALHVLEKSGFRDALISAVQVATAKTKGDKVIETQ